MLYWCYPSKGVLFLQSSSPTHPRISNPDLRQRFNEKFRGEMADQIYQSQFYYISINLFRIFNSEKNQVCPVIIINKYNRKKDEVYSTLSKAPGPSFGSNCLQLIHCKYPSVQPLERAYFSSDKISYLQAFTECGHQFRQHLRKKP